MTDEEKSVKEFIFASKPTDAQLVAQEKIKALKKEKHDLKYELYILRQRVDKLEQQDVEHRKCLDKMSQTIMLQFTMINSLCDLTKGLAEDVTGLLSLVKEEKK